MALQFKVTSRHAASAVAVIASLYFTFSQMQNDKLRQQRDLELSSGVVSESLRAAFEPAVAAGDVRTEELLAQRFGRRGRLAGVALYDPAGGLLAATAALKPRLSPTPALIVEALARGSDEAGYGVVAGVRMRVDVVTVRSGGKSAALAVFHDTAYIENRQMRTRLANARRLAIQAGLFLLAVWVFGLLLR